MYIMLLQLVLRQFLVLSKYISRLEPQNAVMRCQCRILSYVDVTELKVVDPEPRTRHFPSKSQPIGLTDI